MKARILAISAVTAMAFGAAPAFADHNSVNGEGTANMPNDIHNTRIETKEADDNEAFRDFVRYGDGSESVNRFADDDTTATRAKAQKGEAKAAETQTKQMTGNRTNTKVKEQRRMRVDTATGSQTRQRSSRQAGGKRGGKR
jgi:hypothetical protein